MGRATFAGIFFKSASNHSVQIKFEGYLVLFAFSSENFTPTSKCLCRGIFVPSYDHERMGWRRVDAKARMGR
jgi:hypothetical protein